LIVLIIRFRRDGNFYKYWRICRDH